MINLFFLTRITKYFWTNFPFIKKKSRLNILCCVYIFIFIILIYLYIFQLADSSTVTARSMSRVLVWGSAADGMVAQDYG